MSTLDSVYLLSQLERTVVFISRAVTLCHPNLEWEYCVDRSASGHLTVHVVTHVLTVLDD